MGNKPVIPPKCLHCDEECQFHSSSAHVYSRNYGPIWQCPVCVESICGCHPGTRQPLGRPANQDIRKARLRLHNVLDPLWKRLPNPRAVVYSVLANLMGIPKSECHISMFDKVQCEWAMELIGEGDMAAGIVERMQQNKRGDGPRVEAATN